jgi:DNA-binding NtrC family response regulator
MLVEISEAPMQVGVDVSAMVDNKRIFVIERDMVTRAVLQFILHDENETHELAGLDEAYAKGVDWPPDLIILGLGFIEERGAGLLGELQGRYPGCKILVVAETATDPRALECVKAGAFGAVVKPFTVERVRDRVDIALGRKRADFIPLQSLTANS